MEKCEKATDSLMEIPYRLTNSLLETIHLHMYQKVSMGFRVRKQFAKLNIRIPKAVFYWKTLKLDPAIKIEQNTAFIKGKILHSMGAYSYTRSSLPRNTIVGRYCSIARSVTSLGVQHPLKRFTTSAVTYSNDEIKLDTLPEGLLKPFDGAKCPAIIIKNDVWIGNNVVLKPGITVGNGAVIAANAVVTRDVPDYAIIGGIPARVIRYRFSPNTINALLELRWWDYNFLNFKDIPLDTDIENFINALTQKINANKIDKFSPRYFSLSPQQ
ncbi:CatB-related O-acetyltransferase [Shewanella aquimarina]